MLSLILAAALSQTVDLQLSTARIVLPVGARASLANWVANRWPGVPLANVVRLRGERRAQAACWTPTVSKAVSEAEALAALTAGESLSGGITAGTRLADLPERCITGPALAAFQAQLEALAPELTGRVILSWEFVRSGNDVVGQGTYLKPHTAAQAWGLLQPGATLEPGE